MGNRESHDVDSVEQEAGLLDIKTHLSKFDDIEERVSEIIYLTTSVYYVTIN